MLRIASRRKSVRSDFRNHVELRHGEARLARKTLHHFIEPRYLLPRNPLRATGRKRDLVGEEIRERVHADSDAQAKSHPVPPAKNLPHEHEQERESDQQKRCPKNSHSVYSILIVCHVQSSCTNGSVQTFSPYQLNSGRDSRLFCRRSFKAHGVFLSVAVDTDMIAGQHLAFQDLQRKRVLNEPLNSSAQRPSTVGGIITFAQ